MRNLFILSLVFLASSAIAAVEDRDEHVTSAIHACEIDYCSGNHCTKNRFTADFAAPRLMIEKVIRFQNTNYRVNITASQEHQQLYVNFMDLSKKKIRAWSYTPLNLKSKNGYDVIYISPESTSNSDDYIQLDCRRK